ncbi:MAG TPA: hypothetical protein VI775_01975 [Candidatus Paceibacterota bacterium]
MSCAMGCGSIADVINCGCGCIGPIVEDVFCGNIVYVGFIGRIIGIIDAIGILYDIHLLSTHDRIGILSSGDTSGSN